MGVCILPEDARLLQRKVEQQASVGGPYILANMIRLALGKYAVSRSGRDVAETVRTQADVDLGRLVSSMATVHYLAWAIPAIGFFGTVRGLATSLTMGGQTQLEIAAFIKEATGHLNVAFDCTLVALALSLVLMFLLALRPARGGVAGDRLSAVLSGTSGGAAVRSGTGTRGGRDAAAVREAASGRREPADDQQISRLTPAARLNEVEAP